MVEEKKGDGAEGDGALRAEQYERAVGPKAISLSFDDNKTYVLMFLTILFNKISD